MKLGDLYQQLILDHYKNPHGSGLREPFTAQVQHHNPTCGDDIVLRVQVSDGVVQDVSYAAQGCSISVASASMMADLVTGESVATAMVRYDDVLAMLQSRGKGEEPDEEVLGDAVALAGVAQFPARVKCALLSWAACKDAIAQSDASGGEEPGSVG